MLPSDLVISQSLVKKIRDRFQEKVEYCPRRIYEIYIAKKFQEPGTEDMLWGNYGEQRVLGRTRDSDEDIMPPTHKTTGLPLKPQERIDEQVNIHLPKLLNKFKIQIIKGENVQVPIWKVFNYEGVNALIVMHLDIFPTTVLWDDEMKMALIDLKFTGDVTNTFGPFCWGEPRKMDHLQADVYQWGIRDIDLDLCRKMCKETGNDFDDRVGYDNIFTKPVLEAIKKDELIFLYLVLGFKRSNLDAQYKILQRTFYDERVNHFTGEMEYSNTRQMDMMNRIRLAILDLDHDAAEGYPLLPSWDNCNDCPVSKLNGGTCKGFSLINKI